MTVKNQSVSERVFKNVCTFQTKMQPLSFQKKQKGDGSRAAAVCLVPPLNVV